MKSKLLENIKKFLQHQWQLYDKVVKETAVGSIEYEVGEMENIFGLLVLGSFIGLPSPPMQITLDLLPEMERHFVLMLNKVDMANDPLSNLLSNFDAL